MNRQIRRLAVGLLVCYVALFVALNVLQVGKKQALDDNPLNNRPVIRDFNRPRGPIIDARGVILANSVPTDDSAEFDFQRVYPLGDLVSNITGYFTFAFGSTGVERTQDDVLMGDTSEQKLRGIGGVLRGEDDNSGRVVLSVRSDVQRVAADALGNREGSVVVIDPRTGAVIAMVSNPRFDPNVIVQPDVDKARDAIEFYDAVPGKPLLANAYQERYMPGSSFKVITTGIAMENGVTSMDRVFPVESQWVPPQTDDPITNFEGSACGGTMTEVFFRSCNIPFAQMAVELGPQRMTDGTKAWGIGEPVPIDLPRPAASFFGEAEDFVDNLPLLAIGGFGQGNDAMVPLHMAMVAGTVANDGVMVAPYVVAETQDHDGGTLDTAETSTWKEPITPATAENLTSLMIEVVNQGTGRQMQLAPAPDGTPIQAAAKTGTAQLSNTGPERSNAWIIGFAPAEAPQYAIAVVLKGGPDDEVSAGTGGRLAGPIAKTVLDYLFANP